MDLFTTKCSATVKQRFGFTLAEVLITLGIIGVVAAMTIPMLRQAYYEHQTVAQLKETYSILSQAIRMSEEEYGEIAGWDFDKTGEHDALIIAEKLKPFLKLALDCGTNDTNGACIANENYKLLDNSPTHNYASINRYYKVSLLNGASVWWRYAGEGENSYITFFVDTNGRHKPNTWGRDLFGFTYDNTNSVKPSGNPTGDYHYAPSCKKGTSGYGCAYYVLNFGNMNYLH